MDATYKIIVNIKSINGMLEIGSFVLGDNPELAVSTFAMLLGSENADKNALRLDLIKQEPERLPIVLKSISCTLKQYAENSKIITRDIFKFFIFEKGI